MKPKIKRTNIGHLLFMAAIVSLSFGCASLQPQIIQMPTQRDAKTIKVLKADFEGNTIPVSDVYNAIKEVFAKSGEKEHEDVLFRHNYSSGIIGETVRGVSIKTDNNRIAVTYFNGNRNVFRNGAPESKTTDVVAEFPIDITTDGANYLVKLGYPAYLNIIPRRREFAAERQYDDTAKLMKDVESKFNAVESITIKRIYAIKGEAISTYNVDSRLANFANKLGGGSGVQTADLRKDTKFNYKFNGKNLELYISGMPYRNGSKILYHLNLPYTVSNEISIKQSDIDQIKRSIEKIVHD